MSDTGRSGRETLTLDLLWLPSSHGGRRVDPFPGLRLGIRWQRRVGEHLDSYRDIQLDEVTLDPTSRKGRAIGRLVTDVPAVWVQEGELVELLEGFRVVAIGRLEEKA